MNGKFTKLLAMQVGVQQKRRRTRYPQTILQNKLNISQQVEIPIFNAQNNFARLDNVKFPMLSQYVLGTIRDGNFSECNALQDNLSKLCHLCLKLIGSASFCLQTALTKQILVTNNICICQVQYAV